MGDIGPSLEARLARLENLVAGANSYEMAVLLEQVAGNKGTGTMPGFDPNAIVRTGYYSVVGQPNAYDLGSWEILHIERQDAAGNAVQLAFDTSRIALRARISGAWTAWRIVAAPASSNPPFDDWTTTYEASGKRRWRRRWIGVACPGLPNAVMVSAAALPVGMASLGGVDRFLSFTADNSPQAISVGFVAHDTTNAITLNAWANNGANLNTIASSIDFFVELVER